MNVGVAGATRLYMAYHAVAKSLRHNYNFLEFPTRYQLLYSVVALLLYYYARKKGLP